MKFASSIVAATALFSANVIAESPIEVEVRYSKEMVDVGDLSIFDSTWQKIYSSDGNQRAMVTDDTYGTNGNECTSWADGPDNNVRVTVNGAWGRVPGLGPHDSREALVNSLYKVLEDLTNPTGWNVFTNCYGTTWQEGVPIWKGPHACGGPTATVRSDCFCDIGSAQCEFHSWAHKVPSVIKANLYRDGVLLADSLEINFSAQRIPKDEGCGTIGEIAAGVAGFLPFPGPIFAKGISVFCGA
ncbi:hypothetical protein F5X68DRAFT_267991 [Plectosphaerella plurivora]|uniref:Uncharacterized protein n=1 Tax=Plectosphaerella plurivora TaxID=936078 RepID=A0A9P8VGG5_9PEZI|nr:hypothetical protein F5X68DRAFT_267991 [Plectosphaerella plurivora]